MGEHGDHPVRQINTGPPFQSLPVQGAVLLHIVGHIRDVDAKEIVLSLHHKRNRVVQIFGVLPVNGHHLPVPQVLPPRHVRRAYLLRHPNRLVLHPLRELQGQFIPLHNGQDICPRVVHMADDLHDLPFRVPSVLSVG